MKLKTGVYYNGELIHDADMVISTLGLTANSAIQTHFECDESSGRLRVNDRLQVPSHPYCFSAGDNAVCSAADGRDSIMSCQQARPQGRVAGYNAINYLCDDRLHQYEVAPYVTCIDLGQDDALFTRGYDYDIVLTGLPAKAKKRWINQTRIYPPIATDLTALYAAGHLNEPVAS